MTFILCYPIVLQEPLKALKGNTIWVSIENIGGGGIPGNLVCVLGSTIFPGKFVGVNYLFGKNCWG